MSVQVEGLDQLLKQLETKLGQQGMRKLTEKALQAGAKEFDKVLIPELEKFKDTGATVDEVTYSKVEYASGKPKITVKWQGPRGRFRIVHLNEHGYDRNGKKIKPRGYGAIARAIAKGQPVYYTAVKKVLKGGV